jgi:dsDNA-specific endonuclease/ATPase MutS2
VAFVPGDRVHVFGLGTGVVREVRQPGRYVIEVKGRRMVVEGVQMERAEPEPPERAARVTPGLPASARAGVPSSLDLHGKTVEEATTALDAFLNDAILASLPEVRVIHGRSGGRVKAAVHRRLRELPPVRSFRIDAANPGVTIVRL